VKGETATVLRLDADVPGLSLWYRCGRLSGSWRADSSGTFLGFVDAASICPPPTGDWTPAWLRSVTSFRVTGDSRVLLDARGGIVARLLPGGRPAPEPPFDVDPKSIKPPVVTDEVRREFAPAAPLPSALTAVTSDALVGRWIPPGDLTGSPRPPHAELRADGSWESTDGCNGQQGRWIAGPGGALLATTGVSTLIGCINHPVGTWFGTASRAGMDGDALVLLDRSGKELGRVRRG
jgi:hypothetical protein